MYNVYIYHTNALPNRALTGEKYWKKFTREHLKALNNLFIEVVHVHTQSLSQFETHLTATYIINN